MGQRVFEALATHFAGQADLLGLARRPTLLRKKRLWVRLRAQCALLPAQRTLLGAARLIHVALPPRPALLKTPCSARLRGPYRIGLRRMHLPPAALGAPWLCSNLSEYGSAGSAKTANDIGEITCLSIPESQVVS